MVPIPKIIWSRYISKAKYLPPNFFPFIFSAYRLGLTPSSKYCIAENYKKIMAKGYSPSALFYTFCYVSCLLCTFNSSRQNIETLDHALYYSGLALVQPLFVSSHCFCLPCLVWEFLGIYVLESLPIRHNCRFMKLKLMEMYTQLTCFPYYL